MRVKGASRWHMEMIEVFSEATNKRCYFENNAWLGGAHGEDKTISATAHDPNANKRTYKVGLHNVTTERLWLLRAMPFSILPPHGAIHVQITTHTSDVRNAGCNGNVFIDIHGSSGSTGKLSLGSGKSHFDREQVWWTLTGNRSRSIFQVCRTQGSTLTACTAVSVPSSRLTSL